MGLRKARDVDGELEEAQELSAMGLEGMLEALEVVNQRTDRETLGAKVGIASRFSAGLADVGGVDQAGLLVVKHPEVSISVLSKTPS